MSGLLSALNGDGGIRDEGLSELAVLVLFLFLLYAYRSFAIKTHVHEVVTIAKSLSSIVSMASTLHSLYCCDLSQLTVGKIRIVFALSVVTIICQDSGIAVLSIVNINFAFNVHKMSRPNKLTRVSF